MCEKLRGALAKQVGVAGYRSLIMRAMALAKADAPALETVQVGSDGALEGLDGLGERQDAEVGVVVVVHLLSLLVTFIGERLTLGLVREAWPEAAFADTETGPEKQS